MSRGGELETDPDLSTSAPSVRGGLIMAVGDGQVLTLPLDRSSIVIGRDPGCDFVIDHRSLSRRHARVTLEPAVAVEDLGSTNGTRVAGRLHHGGGPIPLAGSPGFQIGPFQFVLIARGQVGRNSATGREQLRIDDPTPSGVPAMVREFATGMTSLLIAGETGVGKEILATTLHELSGRRGPLVAINCAALSESLLEGELFGHERGAFTGAVAQRAGLIEAADQGTLFLDEVGELPLATQAKLLRVFERREITRLGSARPTQVDVRFIAATHRDLTQAVAARTFREDLYYRLDGVTLMIPPLRERLGMIAPLAMRFLAAATRSGAAATLTTEAMEALRGYAWPGNVRELKAVVERAAVLAGDGPIKVKHLTLGRSASTTAPPPLAPSPAVSTGAAAGDEDDGERARIVAALAACAGNQTRAAKMLGMSRTTMVTKLRIYQIPRPTRG